MLEKAVQILPLYLIDKNGYLVFFMCRYFYAMRGVWPSLIFGIPTSFIFDSYLLKVVIYLKLVLMCDIMGIVRVLGRIKVSWILCYAWGVAFSNRWYFRKVIFRGRNRKVK